MKLEWPVVSSPSPAEEPALPGASGSDLESWLARRRSRVIGALVVAAAAVRLLLVLQVAAGPLVRVHDIVDGSDNHFFDLWGRRVAAGDVVQREPFHPMADWMVFMARQAMAIDPTLPARLEIAGGEGVERRLWDRWLGGATWFQEPGYPYLVGLTYGLTGAAPWHVFAWQLALGVLGVVLVHILARRLFSETAAAAAGVLAVLAPIPLMFEVTLLRDGPITVVTLALALAMLWATEGSRRRWFALGLAFGAAALLKQSFLFFPPLLAAWRLATTRARVADRLATAGAVAAGMVVALLPAMVRNALVGVPLLAMNGSAAGMLATFHSVSASPHDLTLNRELPQILVTAGGRPVAALLEAARTHGSTWAFLAFELKKVAYAFHGFEAQNNVDFYLFRQGAPVISALPATFVVLLPLAAAGVAARPRAAWPLIIAIAAGLPTLVLAAALSRYRAAVTVALFPLAGAGVVALGRWVAARRLLPLAVAAALTVPYVVWATGDPPMRPPMQRAATYARRAAAELAAGEPAYAVLGMREAVRLVPSSGDLRAQFGQALLLAGAPDEALPQVEEAARTLDSAAVKELHAQVLGALGRYGEALPLARAALAQEPNRPIARAIVNALEIRDGGR